MIKLFKGKRIAIFPVALMIYALVFLVITAVGLTWFWDFIEAYEVSRPQNTLDAYMQQLTPEYVADRCGDLIASVDHNVQTEQECRDVILEALEGKFSCAKKNKESTEDHYVYALRCGAKVIGTVEMKTTGEETHGFTPWQVTAEAFDLSYLLTEGASVTVPQEFPVSVNGRQLSSEYIVKEGIQYSLLKEYYSSYALPTIVTYKLGKTLGQVQLTVTDPAGNPVTVTEETDYNTFLDNCTEAEKTALKSITDNFVTHYVNLATRKGGNLSSNYNKLVPYMVTNGALAKYIKSSLDGLSWISDRKANIDSITINAYVNVGNGRYMCDVTYVVEQMVTQSGGRGKITNNAKLIILQTSAGLKVEATQSY